MDNLTALNTKLQLKELGFKTTPTHAQLIKSCFKATNSLESKNIYYIAENVYSEIKSSMFPWVKNIIDNVFPNTEFHQDKRLCIGDYVGGIFFDNNENFSLPTKMPHNDQIIIFDGGDNYVARVVVKNSKLDGEESIYIAFTLSKNDEYIDVGSIEYTETKIAIGSPNGLTNKLNIIDKTKTYKGLIFLGFVKCLVDKLFNQKYKYETRQATRILKKRKINPIKNDYKYVSLDYLSLDEVKTLFKYESRNIKGSEKSGHERAGHNRTLKNGKQVFVKKAIVKGGSSKAKIVHIK